MSADGKVIEAYYRILETIPSTDFPPEEQTGVAPAGVSAPSKPTERHPSYLLPNLVGLVLAAFRSVILAWVGWLTWYDITTWSKSLALIFFGPRTGEAISLGIGMKVIYYFLIGTTLLLLSLSTTVAIVVANPKSAIYAPLLYVNWALMASISTVAHIHALLRRPLEWTKTEKSGKMR